MAKLLPPYIESKLPAQTGDMLNIPFQHNRSVGEAQYKGMVLKIKTVATNLNIVTLYSEGKNAKFGSSWLDEGQRHSLVKGQFYKAQLAYIDESDNIGTYSTVGVFKFLGRPTVEIDGLNAAGKNYIYDSIKGIYKVPEAQVEGTEKTYSDTSERVYSYCFNLYKNNELFVTSGDMLHNASEDTEIDSSFDIYQINHKLDPVSIYHVEYIVTTTNGLVVSSPRYNIAYNIEIEGYYNLKLNPVLNYETGCIHINLSLLNYNKAISGNFQLMRSSSLDGFSQRHILYRFIINDNIEQSLNIFNDYTVEQGVEYIYSIQQYNSERTLFTKPIYSPAIQADFEDIFLFDGSKQLKIKFNPKISSFKTTIQESKLDTIGGKFPFIFRNGKSNYKEFPISGLISYWMDNEALFTSHEQLRLDVAIEHRNSTSADSFKEKNIYTTNLTSDNIFAEREFKLQVLNWLNNGKLKLFRSPTEGNYIVRLMNNSLSPNDTVGRMLHTFNSQAYEIADNTIENLKDLNIINQNVVYYGEGTMEFKYAECDENSVNSIENDGAIWFRLYGAAGSKYQLSFSDKTIKTIEIGITGLYEAEVKDNPLIEVKLVHKSQSFNWEHKIEYTIIKKTLNYMLNEYGQKIKSITVYEGAQQFSATHADIISLIVDKTKEQLNNILILRFNVINPNDRYNSIISYTFKDGCTVTRDLQANNLEGVVGYLELTALDFDGDFVLSSLTAGTNIITDIYYVKTITEVEE